MNAQNLVTLLTGITSLLLGAGGSWLGFRSKLRQQRTTADKAQTEYLEGRIASLSKMYEEQGKALDDVRARVLELSKASMDKDERIAQLEAENKKLTAKVGKLEKELATYRAKRA